MMVCDDVESTKSQLSVAQLYGGAVNMGVSIPLNACVLNLQHDVNDNVSLYKPNYLT
jgi:hypothetical protein